MQYTQHGHIVNSLPMAEARYDDGDEDFSNAVITRRRNSAGKTVITVKIINEDLNFII